MRVVNVVMFVALGCLLAYVCTGCPKAHVVVPPDSSLDVAPGPDGGKLPDAPPGLSEGGLDAANDSPPDLDAAPRFPACTAACLALAKLGCPEAAGSPGGQSCYAVCAHAEETHKFDFKRGCLAAAKTVEAVRACGTARCPKNLDAGMAPLLVPVHGT